MIKRVKKNNGFHKLILSRTEKVAEVIEEIKLQASGSKTKSRLSETKKSGGSCRFCRKFEEEKSPFKSDGSMKSNYKDIDLCNLVVN